MEGYIKLPRSILDWEWFDDANTLKVYIKLLFMASFRDCRYKNYELKRGQVLTTIPRLSEICELSSQQTRTILDRLKSTDKITVKTTNKNSIITLIEYDCDFENNSQDNRQATDKQQTNNRQITDKQQTNNRPTLLLEEIKEIKEIKHTCARNATDIDTAFAQFWNAYPKKTAKQNALKAWKKLNPDKKLTDTILSSLEHQKKSVQWTKDDGQFIPYPATWLNGRRWEDDVQFPLESSDDSSFDMNDVINQIKQRYANNS